MTIRLTSDLEEMIRKQADERRTTSEAIIMDVLRERFLRPSGGAPSSRQPADDLRARLQRLATHCGVSLSDEAVSGEGLYE
jgi:hypothetical protein